MKYCKNINNTILISIFVLLNVSCEWPFNTETTNDDIFELTLNHNITRVMPSAVVDLKWKEITVENFTLYKIERKTVTDTSWTDIVDIFDPFQLTYVDTIIDDDNLLYRVGIFDVDDNVIWASATIVIPKTTLTIVPDEFGTIQPAFLSPLMDDGDTILVKPGIYPETLRIAGKKVVIKSIEGYKATTLQPTLIEDPNRTERVLSISSGTLDGFAIELGNPHHAGSGGGIALAENGTVQNCFISGNMTQGEGGGVFLINDGNLFNNIISNNYARAGSGIYADFAHGEIINNTIIGNDIYITGDCSGLLLRNNIVYNSSPDISFASQASQTGVTIDYSLLDNNVNIGSNYINANPDFMDNVDFILSPNSPCIDAGHPDNQYLDKDGTRNDLGAYGGPHTRL